MARCLPISDILCRRIQSRNTIEIRLADGRCSPSPWCSWRSRRRCGRVWLAVGRRTSTCRASRQTLLRMPRSSRTIRSPSRLALSALTRDPPGSSGLNPAAGQIASSDAGDNVPLGTAQGNSLPFGILRIPAAFGWRKRFVRVGRLWSNLHVGRRRRRRGRGRGRWRRRVGSKRIGSGGGGIGGGGGGGGGGGTSRGERFAHRDRSGIRRLEPQAVDDGRVRGARR